MGDLPDVGVYGSQEEEAVEKLLAEEALEAGWLPKSRSSSLKPTRNPMGSRCCSIV